MSKKYLIIGSFFIVLLTIFLFIYRTSRQIAAGHAAFKDVFARSGITQQKIVSGASWSDFDNDGYQDLLIASSYQGLRLYQNSRNDTFTDVTNKVGLPLKNRYSSGVFGDYDNDGCSDLYLVGMEKQSDSLYRNNCDGTFSDVTQKAMIKPKKEGGYRGGSASWADYDNDGYLDLYVVNHGIITQDRSYIFLPNILYHNNHDGTFSDVTKKAGASGLTDCQFYDKDIPYFRPPWVNQILVGPLKRAYQAVWFDYDNDGNLDLFVATEYTASPLYHNNGDGTFRQTTKEAGLCLFGSNMGVTVGDVNNDGNLDLYTTNRAANFLWRNKGDGTFTKEAESAGVADPLSVGWGTGFIDFDNDGDLDLYVVNGVAGDGRGIYGVGVFEYDKLYENKGDGKFAEVTFEKGITGENSKETIAIADYNNDGFEDIFVGTDPRLMGASVNRLYKNQGNNNHWLTVQLEGTVSNKDAVGARIWVTAGGKTQIREIISGSNFFSQNSLWQTFGLGKASIVDQLKIRWPSGRTKSLFNIKPNQKLVISED